VTDPTNGSLEEQEEPGLSSPSDIASAARSCLVILIALLAIGLLLCVAFAIARLT
jgi:hypothetical protein